MCLIVRTDYVSRPKFDTAGYAERDKSKPAREIPINADANFLSSRKAGPPQKIYESRVVPRAIVFVASPCIS